MDMGALELGNAILRVVVDDVVASEQIFVVREDETFMNGFT